MLIVGVAIGWLAVWTLLAQPDLDEAVPEPPSSATEEPAPPPADGPEAQLDSTSPQPKEDPPEADPGPQLPEASANHVAHLEALLESEDLEEVQELSVIVIDEHGREVVSRDPDLPVTPASTNKLLTAAAALRLLGPDYRHVTRAYAVGEVTDGVLAGDLLLVGSGDPALASPRYAQEVYPARPHTPIDDLAAAVEANGISEITGAVRGDARLFADEPVAEGWVDRYFANLDATRVSGLTVDAGRRLLERGDDLHAEVAEDPALHTATVMTDLLGDRDIKVAGEPAVGGAGAPAREIARIQSPPLADLLAHVVQTSDNHMADGLFRTLGALAGRNEGTWADSETTVRRVLGDLDHDWTEIVLADGSGLSRDDRLPASLLAELDRTMFTENANEWQPLMAVAGERGTLRGRLRGTVAEGRLAGKTGALRDTRALTGHVIATDGRRYHFAILGSGLDGNGLQAVRALMDDVVLLLAGGEPPCTPAELDDDGDCPPFG